MASIQFVGARYVPKVYDGANGSSNWVSGVVYEPLTVVTYNNLSYTSRTKVPSSIGNPTDNSEYWVKTADYNAQFAELQDTVGQYANSMVKAHSLNPKNNNAVLFPDSQMGQIVADLMNNLNCSPAIFRQVNTNAGMGSIASTIKNNSINEDVQYVFIILGGVDNTISGETSNQVDITEKVANIKTLCDTKYPQARVYLSYTPYHNFNSTSSLGSQMVLYFRSACVNNNVIFLDYLAIENLIANYGTATTLPAILTPRLNQSMFNVYPIPTGWGTQLSFTQAIDTGISSAVYNGVSFFDVSGYMLHIYISKVELNINTSSFTSGRFARLDFPGLLFPIAMYGTCTFKLYTGSGVIQDSLTSARAGTLTLDSSRYIRVMLSETVTIGTIANPAHVMLENINLYGVY